MPEKVVGFFNLNLRIMAKEYPISLTLNEYEESLIVIALNNLYEENKSLLESNEIEDVEDQEIISALMQGSLELLKKMASTQDKTSIEKPIWRK